MKLRALPVLSACLFLCSAFAQERGYWRASSTTARGVTGDIQMSDYKLTINFTSFTIAQIRSLTPDEITAAFTTAAPGGSGSVYRLDVPGDKRFLHKNTLCGAEPTQYMATYVNGKSLQVAFFSGEALPTFTPEAIANSTNLCGTYLYVR